MMRWLQISGYVFLVLLAAVAVILALGSRLPERHTAAATGVIAAPPERVWGLITDVGAQPGWRTGLKAVEMLPAEADGPCWRELTTGMAMPLCVVSSEAPAGEKAGRRVVRIADPKLPFGGTWTYVVEAEGAGSTRVTITEDGTTGPAMWRFMGHYVTGEGTQVMRYVEDVQRVAGRTGS